MKKVLIIIGTVIAIILLNVAIFAGVSNNIVSLEEQIEESSSGIKIQEKRREDLLYNLVDTAKAYANYENDTLTKLAEARSSLNKGNTDEAKTILNAIAENYPKLKANEQYKQVMLEMATTENLIANYRENYNKQVKNYNKYVRKFPNNIISSILGYKKIDADYLKYDVSDSSPKNLWN